MPSVIARVSEGGKIGRIIRGRNPFLMHQEAEDNPLELWTIRDLRELETLREVWKSWPGTRDSDLDFFSGTVLSRGSRCRPHVIVLTQNGRPEAILVGLHERRKMPLKFGNFTIWQHEVNVLEFVYGALRGNASQEICATVVQQVIKSLDEREADLAVWEPLDVQSPLYNCVLQLPRIALRDHSHCLDNRWLMNFPKSLDGLFMSLGRSQRSKLRRKYKKVIGNLAGKAQIRCFRYPADLESAILDMEEIAGKTDKRLLFGFGFFDTPQTREQMVMAAEKGWLRVYILYLDEKPAAFWMGTLFDRCLQADQVGHDPVWNKFSPGICLFLHILEDLREEDIKIVDFGYRDMQFKRCFGDVHRVESRLHIYAPTPRGIELNLLSMATHRATDCAQFVARSADCMERAKRALRNQLLRHRRKDIARFAGCNPALEGANARRPRT